MTFGRECQRRSACCRLEYRRRSQLGITKAPTLLSLGMPKAPLQALWPCRRECQRRPSAAAGNAKGARASTVAWPRRWDCQRLPVCCTWECQRRPCEHCGLASQMGVPKTPSLLPLGMPKAPTRALWPLQLGMPRAPTLLPLGMPKAPFRALWLCRRECQRRQSVAAGNAKSARASNMAWLLQMGMPKVPSLLLLGMPKAPISSTMATADGNAKGAPLVVALRFLVLGVLLYIAVLLVFTCIGTLVFLASSASLSSL